MNQPASHNEEAPPFVVPCRTLGMDRLPKAEAHRALDDITESMAHLVVCRKWLAQPETPYVGWGRVGDRA